MSDNSGLVASALILTDPTLSLSLDAADSYRVWVKQQGAKVSLYRDYERGDHRASITGQMRKMLRLGSDQTGMNDFNDNYCQIVIDKMAGRLRVSEISLGEDSSDKKWLTPLLEYNSWDALQGTVFRGAVRDGDSFICVDPQTLEWTSEAAYDGFSGVFALFYNNSSTPYWACKMWAEASPSQTEEVIRVVVYEEDKVSYWRGKDGGNELIPDNQILLSDLIKQSGQYNIKVDVPEGTDPNITSVNYMPWPVDMAPVIHFVNKYDNYSDSGESEIRSAIPLQDVLNRTLHSMVMASEFAAFNILWAKGIPLDVDGIVPGAVINLLLKDASGNPVTDPTPEMTAYLNAVQVGQFSGSDISQYTNQIDKIVRELSQATQTPIYGITNQGAVSGEALKQLEIGLIGKCERFQRQNTDAIRDLIKLTAKVQKAFNGDYDPTIGNPPEIKSVAVSWKTPEILDVTAQMVALFQMRRDAPGLWDDTFYQTRIGGLLGLSQAQIKEEGDKALNSAANKLASLVGSAGDTNPPANTGNPPADGNPPTDNQPPA